MQPDRPEDERVNVVAEYQEYLGRFQGQYGDQEFGAFVKYHGRLVKKLRYDEFEPMYQAYFDVASHYFESMDRGDTINDVLVKTLRERAIDLLLTSPA